MWKVPGNSKKANVTPVFKKNKEEDLGNYRLSYVIEGTILEIFSKYIKGKKMIENGHYRFMHLQRGNYAF